MEECWKDEAFTSAVVAMANASERRSKIESLLTEKRAEMAAMKKARKGTGSGRLNKQDQTKKDDLNNDIARLERGLLPGEAEPPPQAFGLVFLQLHALQKTHFKLFC